MRRWRFRRRSAGDAGGSARAARGRDPAGRSGRGRPRPADRRRHGPRRAHARSRADREARTPARRRSSSSRSTRGLARRPRERRGRHARRADVGEARDGVEPHLVGQQALWAGMQELSKEDLEAAETTGFPIVLLILLAVFGSLVAASLPLALGLRQRLRERRRDLLPLAGDRDVGLRYERRVDDRDRRSGRLLAVRPRAIPRGDSRNERSREEALRVAMRTSGLAVVFSGVTVIISLAGLFLVDSTVIQSMAMGAIMVVAIAILAAVTLLPALDLPLRPPRLRTQPDDDGHGAGGPAMAKPPATRRLDPSRSAPRQLLGALDGHGHAQAVAVRRPERRRNADARDSGALAHMGRRRAAAVPRGQRDARGRRARRARPPARARPARCRSWPTPMTRRRSTATSRSCAVTRRSRRSRRPSSRSDGDARP